MKRHLLVGALALLAAASAYMLRGPGVLAATSPLNCNLSGYQGASGLNAAATGDSLAVTWDGDRNQELRLRFVIDNGTPTIAELGARKKGGAWGTLASNVTPEFRVVSGRRRMDREAEDGLEENGIKEITPEVFEQYQWDPFWDAPLNIPGGTATDVRTIGLPRKAEEVHRATATYKADGCEVRTDKTHLTVTFPGVTLGLFAGQLQFTVYKGSNLVQQEVVAKTSENSVAYKYDAGLKGLSTADSRLTWRDLTNVRQDYLFGGAKNEREAPLKTANRLLIAERGRAGSIAAFPPPHNFFWARESDQNLGYSWYRKDSDTTFAFGIRQAENEERENIRGNFALYSARPGTLQHMPVFYYVSAEPAEATRDAVLAFTHGDRYKPIPGYKTMIHHYHMSFGQRLMAARSADAEIVDLHAIRATGINIVSPVDNVGLGGGAGQRMPQDVLTQREYQIEGAKRHSDKDFLVMPDHEFYGSVLGGHTDMLFSHPVYWLYGRANGKPLVEQHPKYGKVYNIGSPEDLMEMVKAEDIILSMPHPRTKNNTGFPDGYKDKSFFKDPHYVSFGYRWGMGIDRSERRLCENRCLALLDEASNWFANDSTPPKYIMAISEVQTQAPGDDVYGFQPINYLKLDAVPTPDDTSSIIKVLQRGDYFISTGEVLIPSYSVQGAGSQKKIVADVEWTFPLDFVEVVWGDGQRTDRQIISTTDATGFGQRRFEIPFDATGKKWVRFAAWDVAGNGALVQPIKLNTAQTSTR
ncbi:MAG TPA: hypothetical protein VGJ52_01300 [Vicinamibacterales bacterium]